MKTQKKTSFGRRSQEESEGLWPTRNKNGKVDTDIAFHGMAIRLSSSKPSFAPQVRCNLCSPEYNLQLYLYLATKCKPVLMYVFQNNL